MDKLRDLQNLASTDSQLSMPTFNSITSTCTNSMPVWPAKCIADGQPYYPPCRVHYAQTPDLSFASHCPPDRDSPNAIHVTPPLPDGTDINTGDGSPNNPWRSIRRAVQAIQPGQAIYVRSGSYPLSVGGRITIPAGRDGEPGRPIWLIADQGVVLSDKLSGETTPFIRVNAAYWIIDGFEFDSRSDVRTGGNAIRVENTHHVVVQNIHAHDGNANSGVWVSASTDVALLNSRVHDFKDRMSGNSPAESHGISITGNSQRILIAGNEAWGNEGDACQASAAQGDFQDNPDDSRPTIFPMHISIVGNIFHEDNENAVDIKSCENVTICGNTFYGYRPILERANDSRQGDAIVIHRYADKILIEANRIFRCGRAASIGARISSDPDWRGAVAVFRGNIVHDMVRFSIGSRNLGRDTGCGLRAGPVSILQIYHNTFYNLGLNEELGRTLDDRSSLAIRLGDDGVVSRAVILNNIVMNAGYAFNIQFPSPDRPNSHVAQLTSDRNLFFQADNFSPQNPFSIDNSQISLAQWQQEPFGYDCSSLLDQDPQFIAPAEADFSTEPESPARDSAIVVCLPFPLQTYGGNPDIGGVESR